MASVPGDPAIECVALGNGPITGWGVASHQLGLVGGIARALARRFGHGAVVRAAIDSDWTVHDMVEPARGLPWEAAQVGILSFGPREVLSTRRIQDWVADLESLVRGIRVRMPADSVLLVLSIPPVQALTFLRGVGTPYLSALIDRYNSAAQEMCHRHEGLTFVPIPETARASPDRYRTREDYAAWGEIIAAFVPVDPAEVRLPVAPESDREAAVERLGILDSAPEERYDRLVRLARSVFRSESAAFTVLHGDRQWNKSGSGVLFTEVHRRYSICNIAVRQGRPLVVGDIHSDSRFADLPDLRDSGIRFYAGYPLRAPDGHFVGALCVYDSEPRDAADVDVSTLRELALLVEAELEAEQATDVGL